MPLIIPIPDRDFEYETPPSSPTNSSAVPPLSPNNMAEEPLQSQQLSKLLEIVDNLRECGVSEDIALPQLVVVGDQSSGKSSILEAITGIPFPVANKLCTRFATQISFRRSLETRTTTTIIPSKKSSAARREELRGFLRTVPELDAATFAKTLEEACECMGLPKPGEEAPGLDDSDKARFSDDILKIERHGPTLSHFSVVDVPGLFQSATQYQTDADALIVESLVNSYIGDHRTIILAVASSLTDTANQKVFRLAKEADPEGIRTVGVLTKPDAVQIGEEAGVIEIARNKVTVLRHGWFVVRNRSTDEVRRGISIEERHENEREFFQRDHWRTLPRERVGIKSLEKFLRQLLFDHIRREIPLLVEELENILADCRKDIQSLGEVRESSGQQRMVLTRIAMQYQAAVKDSLMGYYDYSMGNELKLRMLIQKMNENFADKVRIKGHTVPFGDGHDIPENSSTESVDREILTRIRAAYFDCRGAELPGLINPGVVQVLFQMLTENWADFARAHVSAVRKVVETFNEELLKLKCPEKILRSKIWASLLTPYNAAYLKADAELGQIMEDERGGILMTYNAHYSDSLIKLRRKRIAKAVANSVGITPISTELENSSALLSPADARKEFEEQAVGEIYDVLISYYNVAVKRFVDCVALQVVERQYLGRDGLVGVFSPEFVSGLSDEELQNIAGEDITVRSMRRDLAAKMERLEKARDIARGGFV
ncbi:hypothetical protein RUND412_003108 [Rhizina undulata]